MASKVHNGAMELQHYISINIASSDDAPNFIEDVPGEKCNHPVPTKEEDREGVTWKMDMTGCDLVKVHYENNHKAFIVSGITAGRRTHSCTLTMSKVFQLNQVKLVRVVREKSPKMGNTRLVKLVAIKVGKATVKKNNTIGSFMCWKGSK